MFEDDDFLLPKRVLQNPLKIIWLYLLIYIYTYIYKEREREHKGTIGLLFNWLTKARDKIEP